jgi:hypothetical protein
VALSPRPGIQAGREQQRAQEGFGQFTCELAKKRCQRGPKRKIAVEDRREWRVVDSRGAGGVV